MFRVFGWGKTAKEIAGQLNLSAKTVSVHRDQIKEKLEFTTSAEMIRQAVRYVETEQMGGANGSARRSPISQTPPLPDSGGAAGFFRASWGRAFAGFGLSRGPVFLTMPALSPCTFEI